LAIARENQGLSTESDILFRAGFRPSQELMTSEQPRIEPEGHLPIRSPPDARWRRCPGRKGPTLILKSQAFKPFKITGLGFLVKSDKEVDTLADKQAILSELENGVKGLQQEVAVAAARKAVAAGVSPVEAIENGLARGIREVGEKFARKEMFVVELIYAATIMEEAIKILEPELKKSKEKRHAVGTVVLGTVAGDIHDIGKNLVRIMLEAGGFEVHDMGKDAATESFVSKSQEVGASLVGASSLMTTTVSVQKEIVDALRSAGVNAPVMVGGAAVSEEWAKEIGAHYSQDAGSAVETAKQLLGKGG